MEILSVYLFFCDRLKVCHESDCSLCKMISRLFIILFFKQCFKLLSRDSSSSVVFGKRTTTTCFETCSLFQI